ncbi:MAG: ABC transporter ATP-binding protein [Planctomycetes bacterium]|nr:ABC transporter ATP-binding protein [Planctomycetota bacterium]
MDTLLQLDHLTKDYDGLRALDDVSLDIGAGVTGLLGPNGAGKTTLIKVLLGLVRITRGTGRVMGFELGSQARQIRSAVGYMPEDDCYIGGLSGVEMVRFAARLSGLPSIEGLRRTHEILDFCGIEQERYRNVETYSTGMRQKLKFATAIVQDPPFLILDEPTAGLDPEERQVFLGRIRSLARDAGKAVLISTHILPDVQAICDNVVILARGRVRIVERLSVLSRPTSPSYQVRVFGPVDALVARLQREGLGVTTSGDGSLVLAGADEKTAERVWQWAREEGAGIRSLVPARNSLEQIFLDAVREDDHAYP